MPMAVDLFCGKGGWTIGLQAAGWTVCGFDIDRELTRDYPGHLCIQDVATISGYAMRGKVDLVCASPPCQRYSYMAMPWSRAKAQAAEIRADESGAKLAELNALFEHCFRIAEEAQCPIVIENVKGAQPWVGRAKWHYGSFYLWGDVPAIMPIVHTGVKVPGVKQPGHSGRAWFADPDVAGHFSSKSNARREASAQIAMIPFDLARYIGDVFLPINTSESRQILANGPTVDKTDRTFILNHSMTYRHLP